MMAALEHVQFVWFFSVGFIQFYFDLAAGRAPAFGCILNF